MKPCWWKPQKKGGRGGLRMATSTWPDIFGRQTAQNLGSGVLAAPCIRPLSAPNAIVDTMDQDP